MSNALVRNIHTLVTRADATPLHDVDLRITGGRVAEIGKALETGAADEAVLDGAYCVAYPGFVNTHHHFSQTLTRNVPMVHNARLFTWLRALYKVWQGITPEAIEVSTQVALGELLLSGCTTTTDHFYLFPRNAPHDLLDVEIETAARMGVRFHPCRGSMSLGQSAGGLPPDSVTQDTDAILSDCERVIAKHHDPAEHSMCRVVLAPCSPFSVTPELMRDTAAMARAKDVLLHTHLCETLDEENFCLREHGMRPLAYMQSVDWLGPDVWYAHGIYFNDEEIATLGRTGTGVAHCPASNLRLGSGICKVPQLLDAGVRVGLAVDGSASNDASNFGREMQLALLVHRVGTSVDAMPPQTVLHMATIGGAEILRQPEIGRLEVGAAGDVALFRLDRIDYAGAMHDPASAILFCGAGPRTEHTIVAGHVRVKHGHLVDIDEHALWQSANSISAKLLKAAT